MRYALKFFTGDYTAKKGVELLNLDLVFNLQFEPKYFFIFYWGYN
jgi:hypothetical protein